MVVFARNVLRVKWSIKSPHCPGVSTAGASFFDGTTFIDVPLDGKQFTFGTSEKTFA
jgi:hypothetical protein